MKYLDFKKGKDVNESRIESSKQILRKELEDLSRKKNEMKSLSGALENELTETKETQGTWLRGYFECGTSNPQTRK